MKPVILVVSLFLPFSFSVASAQLTKVTVGYGAVAAGHLPAWMAKESGIFAASLFQRRSAVWRVAPGQNVLS